MTTRRRTKRPCALQARPINRITTLLRVSKPRLARSDGCSAVWLVLRPSRDCVDPPPLDPHPLYLAVARRSCRLACPNAGSYAL